MKSGLDSQMDFNNKSLFAAQANKARFNENLFGKMCSNKNRSSFVHWAYTFENIDSSLLATLQTGFFIQDQSFYYLFRELFQKALDQCLKINVSSFLYLYILTTIQ